MSVKNEQPICMTRNGTCWRMDKDTYFRFIKHVHLYFNERVDLSEAIYSKLVYAEIPVRELIIVCFIFGGYFNNNKELVLMEFFPEKIVLPWKKSFAMFLYTDNNKPLPVLMDARH